MTIQAERRQHELALGVIRGLSAVIDSGQGDEVLDFLFGRRADPPALSGQHLGGIHWERARQFFQNYWSRKGERVMANLSRRPALTIEPGLKPATMPKPRPRPRRPYGPDWIRAYSREIQGRARRLQAEEPGLSFSKAMQRASKALAREQGVKFGRPGQAA